MEGHKVPQQLVKEVGIAFGALLEEVCGASAFVALLLQTSEHLPASIRSHSQFSWIQIKSVVGVEKDMSVKQAFSMVLDRRPDLR
jgi:hypothetical protein